MSRRPLVFAGLLAMLVVAAALVLALQRDAALRSHAVRQALIGTKAACQMLGHLAKLVVFGVAGFAFADYLGLLALLCALVVAGTWAGSQLLDRVNERAFTLLYKGVLTLIALRLALVEAARVLQ